MTLLRLPNSTSESDNVLGLSYSINELDYVDIVINTDADGNNLKDYSSVESDEAALMALVEPEDEQGKLLLKLFAAASRYSSCKMVDRFKIQASILKDMRRLMQEIQKEMSHYKKMGADFIKISEDFQNAMCNFRREANKLFQHLEEVNMQLDMLLEAFLDLERPLNEVNTQNNINLCVDILKELAGMEKLSESAAQTFGEVSKNTTDFQTEQVEPARIKAVEREQRLQLRKDTAIAGTTGVIAGASISGGLVAAPILGGAGAIVIGSVVFPPAAIICGSIVIGLIAIGAIGLGISKLLRNYRTYSSAAVRNLGQLSTLCDQMKGEALFMREKSHELTLKVQDFSASMRGFKYGMHSDQQRCMHGNVCRKAKERNQVLMQTLKGIIDFKIDSMAEIKQLIPSGNQRAIRE